MPTSFPIKSDLPSKTQTEIERVQAIASAQRTTAETNFLTALAPYIDNQIFGYDQDGNILLCEGNTMPVDGLAGFAKGSLFMKKGVATGLKASYENIGTALSCQFDLIGDASSKAGTPVNAVAARGTLTVTGGGTQIADGYTVTIDGKVYTFKTTLTPTEGQVLIGASDTAALANLKSAINHTGTPDTDYKCAAVHPTVTAISSNATTIIVAAKTKGVAGNSLATTKSGTNISWDAATLGTTTAGVDGTVALANEIYVDSSYLYVAIAANTIADANWRRISVGSVY